MVFGAVASEPSQSQRVPLLLDCFLRREDKVGLAILPTKNVQHDSSVSPGLLEEWQKTFERALDVQSRKYEYASLLGKLVTEWLENPNEAVAGTHGLTQTDPDTASQDSSEQVDRAEMQEQRAEW